MNREDVDFFQSVQSQLGQLYKEFSVLAKGKGDSAINPFKLSLVNEKLRRANTLLVGLFRPIADFELFSQDDLPTNSDVVVVLSQYLDGLEAWRSANVVEQSAYAWYWNTDDGSAIKTSEPSRFRLASNNERERPQ